MANDQQRARELAHKIGVYYTRKGSTALEDGFFGFTETELQAYAAALRAAPEVPAARATEPLRADESRQDQADSAIYNRGWNDCRAALFNQHGVAVVADGSQVVPPAALGAHEVHPEAVDAGLDLGEAGESLVAADALEHASGVRQNCDRSANAPERFVMVPVVMTAHMEDEFRDALWIDTDRHNVAVIAGASEAWAAALAARPQGVKDV